MIVIDSDGMYKNFWTRNVPVQIMNNKVTFDIK